MNILWQYVCYVQNQRDIAPRFQKSKDEREQYLKSVDDENKEEVARQQQCEEIEREKRHLELRQQELQKEKALYRSKTNPKYVLFTWFVILL